MSVSVTVSITGVMDAAEKTIQKITINSVDYPVKKGDFNTIRGRRLYAALLAWLVAND